MFLYLVVLYGSIRVAKLNLKYNMQNGNAICKIAMYIFQFICSHSYVQHLVQHICIYISAVKRLIVINHIQNKSFCLHNICVYTVYTVCIMYIYRCISIN